MRWPIHLFSTGRLRIARDALLVHLVVVERAVVGHDDQQRNAVMHRGPERGHAHQEIAVAADRRSAMRPVPLQRERRADRDAGTGADAAAAVGAEEVERMAERPARAVPRQRQVGERRPCGRRPPARSALRDVGRQPARCPARAWPRADARARDAASSAWPWSRCAASSAVTVASGLGRNEQVDRRQPLVVHAPAVVQVRGRARPG